MLGAIAGDIAGSVYEWNNVKHKDFELFSPASRFTDDSVLTIALADSLLRSVSYAANLKAFYRRYPQAGYGGSFRRWAGSDDSAPYNSWGNGAAMRISPVAYVSDDLPTVLRQAREFTAITHNHPEGIKGAQAVAAAVFMARGGADKREIHHYICTTFGYDLSRHVDDIRPDYTFDVSCQGSVPQAIRAFIDSVDFEDALRTAISLGGDSDTIACITGAIAEAYYGGVPTEIAATVFTVLDDYLGGIVREFAARYMPEAAWGQQLRDC